MCFWFWCLCLVCIDFCGLGISGMVLISVVLICWWLLPEFLFLGVAGCCVLRFRLTVVVGNVGLCVG